MSSDFEIQNTKPRAKLSELPDQLPERSNTPDSASKDKPKYDPEELMQIFDNIIFSNSYEEDVVIKGRLRVKFKTRTAEDINRIQLALDTAGLNLISSVEQKRSILILESALAMYQGKDLSMMKPDERTALVSNLPAPVIGALLSELSKFDDKVAAACEEGKENF